MKIYLVMPEDGRWYQVKAQSYKMAYCMICACIDPYLKTYVCDTDTGEVKIFTRDPKIGFNNLITITEHGTLSRKRIGFMYK